ncbi:MAG: epoxyqueuosine reductase QueH [Coriobacteriia bacterium]|nr:epoxyqueuosine reductase QueH [Coriobacteriia bacterium]
MKKLLLHTCCGPCSLLPLEILAQEGYSLTTAFVNPNLSPYDEFQRRFQAFELAANAAGAGILVWPYDAKEWEDSVGICGGPYPLIKGDPYYECNLESKRARCRPCYRLRFERAAYLAKTMCIDRLSTTLTISPYQFTDIIFEELKVAAEQSGLHAVCIDFREHYPESVRRSKQLGMYRQNYCGCRFSQEEARLEREAFKQKRTAKREADVHAHK